MRLNTYVLLILCTTSFLLANDPSYNRGESIFFSKGCNSCHGPAAEGSTSYPRLANKEQEYLTARIKAYKEGKINSVSGEMMAQFVRSLNSVMIKDLTYFLSHHKKSDIQDVDDDILGGFGS